MWWLRFGKEEDFVLNRSAAADMMLCLRLLVLLMIISRTHNSTLIYTLDKIHNKNTITRMENVIHSFRYFFFHHFSLSQLYAICNGAHITFQSYEKFSIDFHKSSFFFFLHTHAHTTRTRIRQKFVMVTFASCIER